MYGRSLGQLTQINISMATFLARSNLKCIIKFNKQCSHYLPANINIEIFVSGPALPHKPKRSLILIDIFDNKHLFLSFILEIVKHSRNTLLAFKLHARTGGLPSHSDSY